MLSVLPKIAISEVSDSVNFSGGILRSDFVLNEFVSSVVVSEIFAATSVTRARADVAYCIHALSRRLHKTRNWTVLIDYYSLLCFLITWSLVLSLGLLQQVALKTLIVIHRLLREGDPTFREELLNFSQRGRILQLSNFKDDSSPIG